MPLLKTKKMPMQNANLHRYWVISQKTSARRWPGMSWRIFLKRHERYIPFETQTGELIFRLALINTAMMTL
jgi:hypothetical protein